MGARPTSPSAPGSFPADLRHCRHRRTKWREITGKLEERLPVQKIPSPFRSKLQGARGQRAASASPGSAPNTARRSVGSAAPSPVTPRGGRVGAGSYAQRALATGGAYAPSSGVVGSFEANGAAPAST